MNAYAKRALVQAAGWSFILLGIVGLFLPVLQGLVFLLVGLAILSTQYGWAHRLRVRLGARFPKIDRTAEDASARVTAWLRRLSRRRKPD
jgi:hypothetical protein